MPRQTVKQAFSGSVTAVKERIRLLRSFDQIHHAYHGYTLVLDGTLDGQPTDELRVGIGPKAHEEHHFRIGDQVRGLAVPVPDERQEWATHYKVSKLRLGDAAAVMLRAWAASAPSAERLRPVSHLPRRLALAPDTIPDRRGCIKSKGQG